MGAAAAPAVFYFWTFSSKYSIRIWAVIHHMRICCYLYQGGYVLPAICSSVC